MKALVLGNELDRVVNLYGERAAPVPGIRGCEPPRAAGQGETVAEALRLVLDGTPAQLGQVWRLLEDRLRMARLFWQGSELFPVQLIYETAAGEVWTADVRDGWLELEKGSLSAGSAVVCLHLVRVNAWYGPETVVPVHNRHGSTQFSTLRVYNHADSAHDNFVEIDADVLQGDLPAELELVLLNDGASPLGQVFVGLCDHLYPDAERTFQHMYEGEHSLQAGGTVVDDSTCSNGQYRAVSVAGSSPVRLAYWGPVASGDYRFYQTVVRLAAPLTAADLWLQVRAENEVGPVWAGPAVKVEPGRDHAELGTAQFPLPDFSQLGMSYFLSLYGWTTGGAGLSLPLDYLALLPVDGWVRLVTAGRGLYPGELLTLTRYGTAFLGGSVGGDYQVWGRPPQLMPGWRARVYLFSTDRTGTSADPGRTCQLGLVYRPKKRSV